MITVTEQLTTPMGTPMKDTIVRVETVISNLVPIGGIGETTSDASGNISFTLEEGVYNVSYKQSDEYTVDVQVSVTDTTPTPITLSALLNNHMVAPN